MKKSIVKFKKPSIKRHWERKSLKDGAIHLTDYWMGPKINRAVFAIDADKVAKSYGFPIDGGPTFGLIDLHLLAPNHAGLVQPKGHDGGM